MPLQTNDFDYNLPPEYIAQSPAEPRDSARLMVLDRSTGAITHAIFRDLGRFLQPGDLLVVNRTRVIPARLFAHKVPTGGKVELLLLRREGPGLWQAMVRGRGLRPGVRLQVEGGPQAEIVAQLDGPLRRIRFAAPLNDRQLEAVGHVPLPPYIHRPLANPERYQTVYAREPGSAAAPTAGLHFTPQLIETLKAQGIGFAEVTLHVGLDTFAPVKEDDPTQHKIHTEWCRVPPETAQRIHATRAAGGRIVAVGTTTVRTLETAARHAPPGQVIAPFEGNTDLFILPGFTFRVVDAMITNFHLPRSTLLMLVSAFAGWETILHAYEVAKQEGYRFFSFGDAMLIL
ncbi:MAG TPA: tRNA preQ1(34) S-adenosylmethionine ribosyltransferase-isomerase QueA [Anaerolineae bacterium]|nr:tRNA preQ1(34) S-adenosylmethionine ribosyltransferase-isomerase QueA [Anaerolineae bacterium]HID85184.1 tRNA preQ1(34) S-adenosylmethionine ribosyltransferase-isomerase QueA [Anaerolineales bacterium]